MNDIKHKRTHATLGLIVAALAMLIVIPTTTAMGAKPVDADGDGFTDRDDCNDTDSSVYPGAIEICGDGIDNNCDGVVDEGCGGGGVVDIDGDGFQDASENAGLTLPSGLVLAETGGTYVPPCDGRIDDRLCVDANRPDIFVIIERASGGNLAMPPYASASDDPLAILREFVNADGAPVVPHELLKTANNAGREIADGQNAWIVNELLDVDFGPLGFAPTGGTPNTTSGEVALYTERIKNEVNRLCSQATICDRNGCAVYPVGTCQNEDGSVVGIPALQDRYTQNVLAHEVWHVASLAPADNPEVILYHFDANTGKVMEQSIGAKGTKAKSENTATVTLYISDTFDADSRAKYKLK